MTDYPEIDPFWVENRAKFLAEKSTSADPNACGTCRGNVAAGEPVEHDGCAQRATLLQAPDHPDYEILAGFSLEENAKLPARFHIPVFDDCGTPNSWLCAVCWEEGVVTGWPCATAMKYGTQVFTRQHEAETAAKKQAARIAELEAELSVYEVMNPQQCPAGKHADWLVDSEHTHACPWCALDEAARVSESLYRRLHEEMLAGSALYAALTKPTTPEQRQAALDQFTAVAQKVGQKNAQQHYDKVPDPQDGCHWCACGNRWPCKQAEVAS